MKENTPMIGPLSGYQKEHLSVTMPHLIIW